MWLGFQGSWVFGKGSTKQDNSALAKAEKHARSTERGLIFQMQHRVQDPPCILPLITLFLLHYPTTRGAVLEHTAPFCKFEKVSPLQNTLSPSVGKLQQTDFVRTRCFTALCQKVMTKCMYYVYNGSASSQVVHCTNYTTKQGSHSFAYRRKLCKRLDRNSCPLSEAAQNDQGKFS